MEGGGVIGASICGFCKATLSPGVPCTACVVEPAAFELPEPAWRKCGGCGQEYMGKCLECDRRDVARAAAGKRVAEGESTIPSAYAWARFGATEPCLVASEAHQELARRARDARAVVFVGGAGKGKTTLAVALMRAWMAHHGQRALFVPAHRLGMARIQHRAGEGDAAWVDQAIAAPLLVLDDLGSERQTATNAVPDVVFERHAAGLPLWVTTGLFVEGRPADKDSAIERVSQIYGDGIARRVFERARVIDLAKVIHAGPPSGPELATDYDHRKRASGDNS